MVNNVNWCALPWLDGEHWSMDSSKITVQQLLCLLSRHGSLHAHHIRNKIHIKIAPRHFAGGVFRWAYHALKKVQMAHCHSNTKNMVVKRFRTGPHDIRLYVRQMELQAIGGIFAHGFNSSVRLRNLTGMIKHVCFTKVETLYVNGNAYDLEAFVPGTYTKYTNNNGYVNQQHYSRTLLAFCHWTYTISGGMLMVTDLQGVHHGNDFWLTDPVIHSSNRRFYETDLGTEGMNRFFRSHRCNNDCVALGLQRHPMQPRH